MKKYGKTSALIAIGISTSFLVSACGSASDGEATDLSDASIQAALDKGGDLLIWGWDATLPAGIDACTAKYPNVNAELVNVGTNTKEYTAFENAVNAGSGIPDLIHLEYSVIPQYGLSGDLLDITGYADEKYSSTYTSGPWENVHLNNKLYGLPMDSGPAAFFYNAAVLEDAGLEVPETWPEFLEAARELKEKTDSYLLADVGSTMDMLTLIWQSGGRPFSVSGESVSIDFEDEGTQQFAKFWQDLLDEELVAPIASWSDEWYQGLGDGTIASLLVGGWMPGMLEPGAPAAAGDWRVAPLPQWDSGQYVTAENGGSALAAPAAGSNGPLAVGFMECINAGEGVAPRVEAGTFPATVESLNDPSFKDKEFDYFGGQKVNEVLVESAAAVGEGAQFLPYMSYARSIFNDHVGQAYVSDLPLQEGLNNWGNALVEYGKNQGFDVK